MRGMLKLKDEGWTRTTIFGKAKPTLDPIGRDKNVRCISSTFFHDKTIMVIFGINIKDIL